MISGIQSLLRRSLRQRCGCLAVLCLALASGCSDGKKTVAKPDSNPAASTAKTNAPAADKGATETGSLQQKSIFVAGLSDGRDPFFPNSARRPTAQKSQPGVRQEQVVEQPTLPASSYMRLSGIWPSKTRPLAMINKTSFAPGETGEVTITLPGQKGRADRKIRVKCLEIRSDTVLISVEGEPGVKELRIPDGL